MPDNGIYLKKVVLRLFILLIIFTGFLLWLTQLSIGVLKTPSLAAAPNAVLDLSLELYADGLSMPTSIANSGIAGDGRLFVTLQGGQIRVIDANGNYLPTAFLNITSKVSFFGENGLLGLAFDPNYANNGFFYVYYTERGSRDNTLARYQVDPENPNQALSDSEAILMVIEQPKDGHNGGGLAFGADNFLYIGVGDGGLEPQHDPTTKPQELNSLLGKILRIDVSETAVNQPDCGIANYAIPASNPFVDGSGNNCDEVWAYGLRNPWRFSFDREMGDLFIGDVGENEWEEINWQPVASLGGENYGWPCYEGDSTYNTTYCDVNPIQHATPILTIPHGNPNNHCSVSGGYIYRGNQYPVMRGHYLLSDFCSGFVWSLNQQNENWEANSYAYMSNSPVTFGEDIDGELYLAELFSGNIYHIVENTEVPNLSISLSGPSESNDIDPIRYELTVNNSGTGAATNLIITNTLPAGATFLNSDDGGVLLQNGTVRWQLASLAANSTQTVSYEINAPQTQTVRNYLYGVIADDGYSAAAGNEVVTTILAPNLQIDKTAPNNLQAGELISYTITVHNSGTLTATNVSITDTIPLLTTFFSADFSGQLNNDTVTWNINPLAPNDYFQVQLVVMPQEIFTEATTIINDTYGIQAEGNYSATGDPVILIFNSEKTYLPLIHK